MPSFLEFYDLVQEHKIDKFLEADFKRGVDYSAIADYAAQNPTAPQVASDQHQGRNTQKIEDPGKKLDAMVRQQNWQKAVEANPNLKFYQQANQALSADHAADKAEDDEPFATHAVKNPGDVEDRWARPGGDAQIHRMVLDNLRHLMKETGSKSLEQLLDNPESWRAPEVKGEIMKAYRALQLLKHSRNLTGEAAQQIDKLFEMMKTKILSQIEPTLGI